MTDALSLKLSRPTALRGNPFHGLVKGGRLTLPNAATMPYPQPVGEHWQKGSTTLIKHPNAPGITRTPEQQAADAAAGLEWWDRAILSGNQLYGKELQGWIYIDPSGDRWMVTTTLSSLHIAGGTCSVTLARFGVLGGEPESCTYSVTVPNMGQATPTINGTTGTRVQRYHSSPAGEAAVFEVALEYSQGYERFWRWRAVGWVEMTLAGPGSACTAAITVRKTRAQALGTTVLDNPQTTADSYYLNRQPDGSKLVQQQPGSDVAATLAVHNIVPSPERTGFTGWVAGMLYNEAGKLQELTLDNVAETVWSTTPLAYTGPSVVAADDDFAGSFQLDQSWVSTLTMTYKLGGAVICTHAISISETSSETLTYANNQMTQDYSVLIQCDPGGSFSTSSTGPAQNAFMGGTYTYGFSINPAPVIARQLQQWWFETGDHWRYLQPCPYRYSNQLFGLCLWGRPFLFNDYLFRADYLNTAGSPAGQTTLPALVIEKTDDGANDTFDLFAYASHCPVTGHSARDSEPVCYV
ncbi:hypothetical protein [Stutzerimonas chloritidismutans]|uniref:hypothetical protein n=1 Tax=Stutzerimonas chloritidismutans TaxID=203192 RepID=UPI0028A76BF9|nr:hypothetical protein [Stutzerimonas chloritidismutans]